MVSRDCRRGGGSSKAASLGISVGLVGWLDGWLVGRSVDRLVYRYGWVGSVDDLYALAFYGERRRGMIPTAFYLAFLRLRISIRRCVLPPVCPSVYLSVRISAKPQKLTKERCKTLWLCTNPIQTNLFARPGFFLSFLYLCVWEIRGSQSMDPSQLFWNAFLPSRGSIFADVLARSSY